MTTEELLKPRYKVIADYPECPHSIGEIFTCSEPDSKWSLQFKKYPLLFKPLAWWEEREEKDMPEYVRYVGEDAKIKQHIFKVTSWDLQTSSPWFMFLETSVHPYQATRFIPATKEEYENQNR